MSDGTRASSNSTVTKGTSSGSSDTALGDRRTVLGATVAAVVVFFLSLLTPIAYFSDWKTRAYFGETLGGATAVFGAVAFIAVAITLRLQAKQLGLQQQEILTLHKRNKVDATLDLIKTLERRLSSDRVEDRAVRLYVERLYQDLEQELGRTIGDSPSTQGG